MMDVQAWSLRLIDEAIMRADLEIDGNAGEALDAFAMLLQRPADRIYKTGLLGIEDEHLLALAYEATKSDAQNDPVGFFTSRFSAFEIEVDESPSAGLLTGFYEPEAEASPVHTDELYVPLYAKPDDLVEVDSHPDFPEGYRFGRKTADGVVPYHDRQVIEQGALAGHGLEIAWLRDPVDAFFIHIQGAALLHMIDGSKKRVTYAAKSGHPFTGIGKILVDQGEIDAATVSMQSIRAWLADNPDRAQALMWQNRSFIFFRETEFNADDPGPIAAAKVPLSPLRSIAVDRMIHTFGTPFLIKSYNIGEKEFCRLMIAQDTGSAIVGPARADLYFGTGVEAGNQAGGVKAKGSFTVLVPNDAVPAVMAQNRVRSL